MQQSEKKLQFRPRARIIRTIGDQLISGAEAAVIELVKNSYDADASYVSIAFVPPLKENWGRIIVSDDGHGMTLSDMEEKWMEPATVSKLEVRLSPKKRRPMMGSKGIGRFAAAKLGHYMALLSVSERTGKNLEVLIPRLDWNVFSADAYLSDVSIDYLVQETTKPTGTTIEISALAEDWTQFKMTELYRELRRLVSPLDKVSHDDFAIYLDLSACNQENTGWNLAQVFGTEEQQYISTEGPRSGIKVEPFPILSSSDYEIDGYFDPEGNFHGTMQINRGERSPSAIQLSVPLSEDEQSCGVVVVRLYLFDREAAAMRSTVRRAGLGDVSAAEARQILDNVTGVAIYRDGFRVRPYGDPANDWLTLDKRRVQDPSLRIGHNQVAGYITIQRQEDSGLVERSSREGLEQNPAFKRLYRLIVTLLAEVVEPTRENFRTKAGIGRRKQTTFEEIKQISEMQPIKDILKAIPLHSRGDVSRIIEKQTALLVDKIDALEERQRILEAQSSLGQIIGEVLHEGAPSAAFLARTGKWMREHYPHLFDNSSLTEEALREFPGKLELVRSSGEKLRSLFTVLRPLSGAKRGQPDEFDGTGTAFEVIGLFDSHNMKITVSPEGQVKRLVGYREDLKTALVNLVSNSIHWLEQAKTKNPTVNISIVCKNGLASIFVDDNGPGIPEEFVDRIFEVGFTLKDGGTGLGLNIAKEALARSAAKLFYHPRQVGGTRFEIQFPCLR